MSIFLYTRSLLNRSECVSPLYDFECPECGCKVELIQTFKAETPLCPHCHIPMKRGCGSLALLIMKDEQGTSTAKKYAAEITRKTRK